MKNIGHLLLALLALLVWVSNTNAQNVDFTGKNFPNQKEELKKANEAIKTGDELFDKGPYFYNQALPYYLKANMFNPNNALLNFKIGNCYMRSAQKAKSIEHLEKAQKLNPELGVGVFFSLASAYHVNQNWDKAIELYRAYKSKVPTKFADEQALCDKRIKECEYGKNYMANPTRVLIENVGDKLNTFYPDYSPVISADESIMFFTSRRDNTTGGGRWDVDQLFYEDVYKATRDDKKMWGATTNIGPPVNTQINDATVNLSPDGQRLITYKDQEKTGGDLYESVLTGNNWSEPKAFGPQVNTSAYETHASYSYDGRMLYFVSDKKDGSYGGKDVYYCYIDDKGLLGEPINMGPDINTQFDEDGIYAHPDGKTLYFSSQGHTSMGGYDIFRSKFIDGKWQKPENLGYPINSADDDVFFVVAADGKHAYFSSFKNDGYGEKDIYRLTFLGDEKPFILATEDNLLTSLNTTLSTNLVAEKVAEPTDNNLVLLKGIVYDKITKKPLEGTIEIVDIEQNTVVSTFKSNSATGRYLVSLPAGRNYSVTISAPDYLFASENFDIPKASGYLEVEKNFPLDKIDIGRRIVLKNVFFNFDKFTLREESTSELNRLVALMNAYPRLKIEVSGHTDNVGSETYNRTLSDNRSRVVVEFLVKNGIDKSRLVSKGYWFSQPIASNDIDEGRQLNRRTEVKILAK